MNNINRQITFFNLLKLLFYCIRWNVSINNLNHFLYNRYIANFSFCQNHKFLLNTCFFTVLDGKFPEMKWHILTRGAGSQFVMSVPHGALNFVVTEVRT